MTDRYLALLNRAAGGGRCGRLADQAIDELRGQGVAIDVAETRRPGHATELAREAYHAGRRRFIAVGGDGTSYEILNGLFPDALGGERPRLAFLPLGTGNSFLRDFAADGAAHARQALIAGRQRACDVLRLTHAGGAIYYINLLSIGFAADVATLTNRRFKPLGHLGYLLGVIVCLLRLPRRAFPHRTNRATDWDRQRCLFLTFNNSKYTGGTMMIAPDADTADGLIEFVRWGPVGRLALLRHLHRLYDGTHVQHPMASRGGVRSVEFDLDGPVDIMVDGEVATLHCQQIDVLPAALDVVV